MFKQSVLGLWRLREDEHNEHFPIRATDQRETDRGSSETEAARDWLKTVGWSVKRVRERLKRKEGEREMRKLIFGCDLKQLFLCSALKMDPRSFPLHPATLFMLPVYCLWRDRVLRLPWREKENQFDSAINHRREEWCFTKECRHVSVSFCFYFAKTLTETVGAAPDYIGSSRWHRGR